MKSNLNMTSVEVKAETRAIRCTWTPEMVNDIRSYHGLDAEKGLAHILNYEIRKERISKRKKSINKIFQN